MRILLFGLIAVMIMVAGCAGGTRGPATCKEDKSCQSWQFCNQSSSLCITKPGYCDNETQCSAKDPLMTCDLASTHLCIFSQGTCRINANCEMWQVCASGTCRAAPSYCESDSQCDPAFEFCNPSTHKCGPAPGYCISDTDCDSWKKCDVVSKRCYMLPGRCDLDADCLSWQACDIKTHNCNAKAGYCVNQNDCEGWARCDLQTKKCVARQGYCGNDNECNDWEFCNKDTYQCTPQPDRCGSNENCGDWQVCDSGHFCNAKVGFCDSDGDCVQGEVCNQGTHKCQ